MLDYLRHLRPFDRFVMVPWLLLFPVFMAWVLSGSIIKGFGPGTFGVVLVTMAAAALFGVILVHRHGDEFPATLSLGLLIAAVTEFILLTVSWNRSALVLMAFVHAAALTFTYIGYLEKKWQAERAADLEREQLQAKIVDGLERNGGVSFSMASCGDSACYCAAKAKDDARPAFKPKGPNFPMVA